jgi:hypothetical protein
LCSGGQRAECARDTDGEERGHQERGAAPDAMTRSRALRAGEELRELVVDPHGSTHPVPIRDRVHEGSGAVVVDAVDLDLGVRRAEPRAVSG